MNIGIIGCGTMGTGIAQLAATKGNSVIIFDTSKEAMDTSKQRLVSIMTMLVSKDRLTIEESENIINNISYSNELSSFFKSDLIIEAIIENLEIKKSVFKKLEEIVSENCILASNTSSLSIASLASACFNPERVIGIHFFNPAPIMRLVEIIPAIQTNEKTVKKSIEIIESWNKTTVKTKDTPGFIVNRVARSFYGESLKIYEEGFADFATIDWALKEIGNFRMGPFELMDYIGNDINFTVTETVYKAFYFDPRYKPSFTQKRLFEAGFWGRKKGQGYYNYTDKSKNILPLKDYNIGEKIFYRVLAMLINEAADALFMKIASRDDIDNAMTLGANYPKGLLQWADEIGIQECVNRIDKLYNEYHEDRYRCSPLLRRMSRDKTTFY